MVVVRRVVGSLAFCVRLRLCVLFAVLALVPAARASSTDEQTARVGPSAMELSRQVSDCVPAALAPSPWTLAVRDFERRNGQTADLARLVAPSMVALDTFFHDLEPVPHDKVLHVVVRDGTLVFDLVEAANLPARPWVEGAHAIRVQTPADPRLLPPETEGLLELPNEVSRLALLVSHVAAVLEARALEFVVSFRSLFGLHDSPQALKPVRITHGGGRVRLPTGDPLVEAYRDREEDEDEDPMVARKFVLRSGVKILLGFCLGLLFWGVIRNL